MAAAKRKQQTENRFVSNEMSYLFSKGIKIYPAIDKKYNALRVCIETNGKKKYGSKLHTVFTINKAIIDTIEYKYNKIKNG